MKMKMLKGALLATSMLMGFGAQAELVNSELGSMATLDTLTGKVWLDLTITDGYTQAQVDAFLAGTYGDWRDGWRYATYADIVELFDNQFPGATYSSSSGQSISGVDSSAVNEFRSFFGTTGTSGSTGFYATGLFEDDAGILRYSGTYTNGSSSIYGPDNSSNMDGARETGNGFMGYYLVQGGNESPVADVASPFAFGALALSMLAFGRRRAK